MDLLGKTGSILPIFIIYLVIPVNFIGTFYITDTDGSNDTFSNDFVCTGKNGELTISDTSITYWELTEDANGNAFPDHFKVYKIKLWKRKNRNKRNGM